MSFKHITTNHGLSENTINAILQDDDGYMWFATRDGLNKYDGYTLKIYRNDPSAPKSIGYNFIYALCKDSKGMLWIGADGGLSVFDRNKEAFTNYTNNPADSASLSNNRVSAVVEDANGNLWIGTLGGGLNMLDIRTKRFRRFNHVPGQKNSLSNNFVQDIKIDKQSNIWIATHDGLNRLDASLANFTVYQYDSRDTNTVSHNQITKLYIDGQDNVWIGTEGGGLNFVNAKTEQFVRYKPDPKNPAALCHPDVISLEKDRMGQLWVGTRNGGISILAPDLKTFFTVRRDENNSNSLNSNSIYSIYSDKHGDVWVGTYSGGVNFFSRIGQKFVHYKSNKHNATSLSHANVLCVREDSYGNLWVGTDGGGLNFRPAKAEGFKYYRHNPADKRSVGSDFVLSVYEDRDHDIWVGNFKGGLSLYQKETDNFFNFPITYSHTGLSNETVCRILQDKNGYLWFGTFGSGISRYDKKAKTFQHFTPEVTGGLNSRIVLTIYEDKEGNLWVGTEGGGLNWYHEQTNSFSYFKHDSENPRSISNNLVNVLYEDSKGRLWVGTNGGLNLFDRKTRSFSVYREKDGLPNDVIYGIVEDDHGNLWLSTSKGLSRFNPEMKTFRNFTVTDGLQSNSFNNMCFFKNKKGEMFFGGLNGLNVFHPDSIRDNAIVPDVHITKFQIFNKGVGVNEEGSPLTMAIDKTREIALSYKQSVFSFEFAALNYVSPEKNQYAYKMEGFDKEWVYLNTHRQATYTNLDPGRYTFRVKASNNDGVWNETGTSIDIIITPPYWRTWWFRMVVGLVLLGSIYAFFKIRVSSMKKQKALLEEQVRQHTAEVMMQKEALEVQAEDMQALNEELQAQTEFLQSMNDELQLQKEEIIAKREEAEKAQKEAEKAQQEAERANRAKSIFLATMSHEIRTPMNGVLGMASLLAETPLTIEQQEYTDTIRSSGEALLTVINDILDFSKIESGNLELDCHSFDLRQCIEEVMDVFSAKSSQKGLDLVYQIDYQVPAQIISDSHRLRQILLNLIGNAMKFTHQGEIFVGVELVNMEKDLLELAFHVRDTGIGIPPDKLSRLFKAFSQIDSSTTRKYGGTGLGLAISQRLVELMGGTIWVESDTGKGTTFSFTTKSRISQESIRQYVHCNTVGNEGKRALLIDDNITNLTILKNQLEQWRLTPILAASGQQALDILAQPGAFDLVITDMQMPGMDGVQLARAIKSQYQNIPVILLSSVGDESRRKYPELFSAVLNKPVKQQQLCRVIQQALRPGSVPVAPIDNKLKQVLLSEDFAKKFPLRILLAEDNLVNQKLAIRVLNKLGYHEVIVAQNGLEVLERLREQYCEVILMDVQMPEMDGLEATRMIRLQPDRQPVIISMTANAMQEDREICLQAGMNDYISKPIRLEELINALERASAAIHANSK